jgi:hypothetical protein
MLKQMSNRVAQSCNNDSISGGNNNLQQVFIDPASIALYMSIIVQVVKLVKACREAHSVPTSAQQPTRFERNSVKRIVRRKLGFIRNLREGKKLVQSIFDVGAGSTVGEIDQLYNEVN